MSEGFSLRDDIKILGLISIVEGAFGAAMGVVVSFLPEFPVFFPEQGQLTNTFVDAAAGGVTAAAGTAAICIVAGAGLHMLLGKPACG